MSQVRVIYDINTIHPPVAAADALILSQLDSYAIENGNDLYLIETSPGHYVLESDTGTSGFILQSIGDKILLS